MEEKELLKLLFSVLENNVNEHITLNDNGTEYSVDLTVKDGVLDLHMEKKEDKEFEKWVKTLDDEIFQDALDRTIASFEVDSLSEIKDKEELKQVFKSMVSKIATEKMEYFKTLI